MKKILFAICVLSLFFKTSAQNTGGKLDDAARIVLNTFIPDQVEGLTESSKANLSNKLSQIATKAGMGGSATSPRFIITANVAVLTKDITPTAPPMHAYTIEITFYIGDGIAGTKFSSTSLTLKGVGTTETKAYNSALQNLKVNDARYQTFIETGKTKIIEYYNSRCDFILKEAEMFASKNEFDSSIAALTAIPEVCKDCYDKAMNAVGPIYQKLIDRQCKIDFTEAKNAWNTSQDNSSAEQASVFLAKIDPNSSCYNDAQNFSKIIAKRINDLDKREWEFKMKQQEDNVDLQKLTIKAVRDIGVAYGKNQPKVIYNIRGWW
ncbi:hypothetical protein [Flavobacterium sp. W22_SRS_FP1]|uniref:hypothetical protein n=1 Tax=Flavobacterium sp. W22_SRS_FP1 TaxID=3240276 RepID=UPI003F8E8251